MLNLNYNIIGSVNVGGAQPFRAGAVYSVRNDIYSASIVVAIPGNLFRDGDYQNQFGMNYGWDDMSSYVKAGTNGTPIGSNLSVEVATSGSGVLYPTSSVIKFPTGDSRYDTSLFVNSTASLKVLTTFPAYQGVNLSYSSSFVAETWIAWNITASLSQSGTPVPDYGYSPTRYSLWKYDPSSTPTAAYIWENTWGGDVDDGIGVKLISGSSTFISDFVSPTPFGTELQLYGTSSILTTPYVFNHYAVSYTKTDTITPANDRLLRIYVNGICQNQYQVPINVDINQATSELLQIFGVIDGSALNPGRGEAYFQDFRMYNGTNKNYTGSLIPLPQSMVVWN